jgi:hypothetical protein
MEDERVNFRTFVERESERFEHLLGEIKKEKFSCTRLGIEERDGEFYVEMWAVSLDV